MNRPFRLLLLLALLRAPVVAAEPVVDPFPEKIKTAQLQVGLQKVADGFDAPLRLMSAPGVDQTLYIVDQSGVVVALRGKHPGVFLDVRYRMPKLRKNFDERGLLGLAFHPGYGDPADPGHRKIYTYTSEPVDKTRRGGHPRGRERATDPSSGGGRGFPTADAPGGQDPQGRFLRPWPDGAA